MKWPKTGLIVSVCLFDSRICGFSVPFVLGQDKIILANLHPDVNFLLELLIPQLLAVGESFFDCFSKSSGLSDRF